MHKYYKSKNMFQNYDKPVSKGVVCVSGVLDCEFRGLAHARRRPCGLPPAWWRGNALRGAGMVATEWENSQTFQVTHVRIIPCAKSDVDEDKVVSWSITAISFF